MSYPYYPNYKDNNVQGLGKVPSHWKVLPLKTVSTHNNDVLIESTAPDAEIFYVDISSVDGVNGIKTKEPMLFSAAPSRARRLVKHGDVIVSTVRTYLKAIARIRDPEDNLVVSTGFAVIRPRSELAPDFLGCLVFSRYFVDQVIARSTGVSYPAINASELVAISVPVPPLNEQMAIASFLDRETAKIDELTKAFDGLVDLLKEKRQAVISHAVTKGLDPTVPMKDSGIEWVGKFPAHWAMVPFSDPIGFQEGPGIMAADFRDEGVPLMRISGVRGRWASLNGCNFLDVEMVAKKWSHFKLKVGDLLISASATMGTVCEVGDEAEGSVPYTGLIRITPRVGRTTRDYTRAILASTLFLTQIDLLKAGATIQHFGPTHLQQMKVVLPPISEQERITEYLACETGRIDALIADAEGALVLLQERRAALISAAVTGKIDVRGLVIKAEAETLEIA